MKKMTKKQIAEWEKQRRQEVAYHEAGHAVCAILFGNRSDIDHIDMIGTEDLWAFVRSRNHDRMLAAAWIRCGQLAQSRAAIARYVFFHLCGPCAGSKYSTPDNHDSWQWLQDLFDDRWDDDEGDSDLGRCLKALPVILDSERKQMRFLEMIARWADEAMNTPQIWGAVTRLAEKLITVTRLDADEVLAELDAGANYESALPMFMSMGRKWKRRFFPPIC